MSLLKKIVIPGIAILIVGGIISFFLAYNFYPEKHVNINLNGTCYELAGPAYQKYKELVSQRDLEFLKLKIGAVKPPNAIFSIIFTGTKGEIANFTTKYSNGLTIVSNEGIVPNGTNVDVDRRIVKATVTKSEFQRIVNDLTIDDFDPLKKTVGGSIGLQSTPNITPEQEKQIESSLNQLMHNGIYQIVVNSKQEPGSIKSSECRG